VIRAGSLLVLGVIVIGNDADCLHATSLQAVDNQIATPTELTRGFECTAAGLFAKAFAVDAVKSKRTCTTSGANRVVVGKLISFALFPGP